MAEKGVEEQVLAMERLRTNEHSVNKKQPMLAIPQ